jgi:hypothetical protein
MYLEVVRDKEGKIVQLVGPVQGLERQGASISGDFPVFIQRIEGKIVAYGIEAIEVSDDFSLTISPPLFGGRHKSNWVNSLGPRNPENVELDRWKTDQQFIASCMEIDRARDLAHERRDLGEVERLTKKKELLRKNYYKSLRENNRKR